MKTKVKALIDFTDMEENVKRKVGDEWVCSLDRADYLLEHKAIEVVTEIKPKKEIKVEEKEEKPKNKKSSKR